MIPWFYLIPAVVVGAIAGFFMIAILSANGKDGDDQ